MKETWVSTWRIWFYNSKYIPRRMKHSCSLLNSAFWTSKYELLLKTEYLPSRHFHIMYGWLVLACYTQNILPYMFKKHIFHSIGIICPSPLLVSVHYLYPNSTFVCTYQSMQSYHILDLESSKHTMKNMTRSIKTNLRSSQVVFHLALGLLHICDLLSGYKINPFCSVL